jgi:hypothetical protein
LSYEDVTGAISIHLECALEVFGNNARKQIGFNKKDLKFYCPNGCKLSANKTGYRVGDIPHLLIRCCICAEEYAAHDDGYCLNPDCNYKLSTKSPLKHKFCLTCGKVRREIYESGVISGVYFVRRVVNDSGNSNLMFGRIYETDIYNENHELLER